MTLTLTTILYANYNIGSRSLGDSPLMGTSNATPINGALITPTPPRNFALLSGGSVLTTGNLCCTS